MARLALLVFGILACWVPWAACTCSTNLATTTQFRNYFFAKNAAGIVGLLANEFAWFEPTFTVNYVDPQLWVEKTATAGVTLTLTNHFNTFNFSDTTTRYMKCAGLDWTVLFMQYTANKSGTIIYNFPVKMLLRFNTAGKIVESWAHGNSYLAGPLSGSGSKVTLPSFPNYNSAGNSAKNLETAYFYLDCIRHQNVTCLSALFSSGTFYGIDPSYTLPNAVVVMNKADYVASWVEFFASNSFVHMGEQQAFAVDDGSIVVVYRADYSGSNCVDLKLNDRTFDYLQFDSSGKINYVESVWNTFGDKYLNECPSAYDCSGRLAATTQLRDYFFAENAAGIVNLLADDNTFSWNVPKIDVSYGYPDIWTELTTKSDVQSNLATFFSAVTLGNTTTRNLQCSESSPDWTVLFLTFNINRQGTVVYDAPRTFLLRWNSNGKIVEAWVFSNSYVEQLSGSGGSRRYLSAYPGVDTSNNGPLNVNTAYQFLDCLRQDSSSCVSNLLSSTSFVDYDPSYELPNGYVINSKDAYVADWASWFAANDFVDMTTQQIFSLSDGSVVLVTKENLPSPCVDAYNGLKLNARTLYYFQFDSWGKINYVETLWNTYGESALDTCSSAYDCSANLELTANLATYFFAKNTAGVVSLAADNYKFSWYTPSTTHDADEGQLWDETTTQDVVAAGYDSYFSTVSISNGTTRYIACSESEPDWTVLLLTYNARNIEHNVIAYDVAQKYLLRWENGKIVEAWEFYNTYLEEVYESTGNRVYLPGYPSDDTSGNTMGNLHTAHDFVDCIRRTVSVVENIQCLNGIFSSSFTAISASFALPNDQSVYRTKASYLGSWAEFFQATPFYRLTEQHLYSLTDGSVVLVVRADLDNEECWGWKRNSRTFFLFQFDSEGKINYVEEMWNTLLEAEWSTCPAGSMAVSLMMLAALLLLSLLI